MSTVILRGDEALHFAEVHHLGVNCDGDEDHAERHGISVEEGREIAHAHPERVWIEIQWAVNTGEDLH